MSDSAYQPELTVEFALLATGGRFFGMHVGRAFTGVSTDSRTIRGGELFFALRGERFDGHDYVAAAVERGARAAVVENAFDRDTLSPLCPLIVVDDTLAALGRLAAEWRKVSDFTVVAVTGSNGKTTTKDMCAHLIGEFTTVTASPKSYNNFIGVPLTLLSATPEHEVVVVEIGTNRPGEVLPLARMASPDVGVITNVGRSHLEGFGTVEAVAREKASLACAIRPGGALVVNADSPEARFVGRAFGGPVVAFGVDDLADLRAEVLEVTPRGSIFRFGKYEYRLHVPGRHNVMNALAALAVCDALGMRLSRCVAPLADFRLPEMRLQKIPAGGRVVINDAYNANPESAAAAIETFALEEGPGRKILVFGDMLEMGDAALAMHEEIGRIATGKVDYLVAVGEYAEHTAKGALDAGMARFAVTAVRTRDEARDVLRAVSRPGDMVLVKGSRRMRLEELIDAIAA